MGLILVWKKNDYSTKVKLPVKMKEFFYKEDIKKEGFIFVK
jgi:hypothetical protein